MARMRCPPLAPVLALCTLLATGCHAPETERLQAQFEPHSAPGAVSPLLVRMVGDWDVAKTVWPRDGGEAATTSGTCRQFLVQGDHFLQCDFRFGEGSAATTGTGVIGYDAASHRFTSTWFDSRSTRMSVRQGPGEPDAASIQLEGQALGDPAARRSRTESVLDPDGNRIVHRQWSRNADGSERLAMQLVLTRHPAAR